MAVNGQVVILPMMYLALSYDHRLIDGKEAVSFLVAIKDLLEDYESPDFSEGDHQLVTEIISITGQNQQQLQLAMAAVQSQIQTEDRSLNTMRKVHQTYGQQGGPSFWHSYS